VRKNLLTILLSSMWLLTATVGLMLSNVSHANEAAASTNQASQNLESTLFYRMGGLPVLKKIVDEFIDEVAKNEKTKRTFDGIKLKTLKESVVMQLCKISGGGCIYEGETMLNSHKDAKITEAEFDAFVGIFREIAGKYLPTAEKNALLKLLAPMKRDIVTPK